MFTEYEIASVLLAAGVVAAAVHDIRYRLIPNRLTYSLVMAGAIVSLFDGRIYQSATALGLCMFIVLPLYLTGSLGGGDLKLLSGVSLFGDWHTLLECLFFSTMLGATVAILYLALNGGSKCLPGYGQSDDANVRESGVQRTEQSIPLAAPIAVSVICVHVLGIRLLV